MKGGNTGRKSMCISLLWRGHWSLVLGSLPHCLKIDHFIQDLAGWPQGLIGFRQDLQGSRP